MRGLPIFRPAAFSLLLVAAQFAATGSAYAAAPVVFAAASLKTALDDVAALYRRETGHAVVLNYAGSATLAKQIEQAAPADVFISANIDWMDYLDERGLIDHTSRTTLLGNAIVLVAPKDSEIALAVEPGMPLAEHLGSDGRLAMANVDSVPAGLYGKAALEHLNVWDAVAGKVVQADNVRTALAFVARGEAPLGIVYATDAAAEPAVRIVDEFPAQSHPPILYAAALTTASNNPDAAAFLDFLESDTARPAFERQGFIVIAPGDHAGQGG
jgi:molybdate transport system substrate-binding protein